jgi:CubicO group peptidase (beta-lactamase class C family)
LHQPDSLKNFLRSIQASEDLVRGGGVPKQVLGACANLTIALALSVLGSACSGREAAARLDSYVSALAANRQFSGAILVADHGRVVFLRAAGYADLAARRPNEPGTPFPIASVSKLFTATAVLQLVQSGRVRLGSPVAEYLQGFPYPDITIRQLLSHTSGLPPYNSYFDSLRALEPNRVFANADLVPQLRTHPAPLRYVPGASGNYDNINYLVLAEVVRAASGEPYGEYVREHIIRPAGMSQTVYHAALLDRDSGAAVAVPYIWPHVYSTTPVAATAIPYAVSYWHSYQFAGFSGYVSTLADLLRFDRALYGDSVLSQATLREAFVPVRLNDGTVNADRFGLGWEVEADSSMGTIVYHTGSATGLSCALLRNITADQAVIVFENTGYDAHEVALNVLRILNHLAVAWPRRSLAAAFGVALASRGAAAAADTLRRLRDDTLQYYLSEDEVNSLGYDFMGVNNAATYHLPVERRVTEALAAFRANTELFPRSWNVWDSYGESLLAAGLRDSAVATYRRSLELNAKNRNGRRILDSLLAHPPHRLAGKRGAT